MFNIDNILEKLKKEFYNKESMIKYLRKENEFLKDEHYKDEELQRMKTELEKIKCEACNGFTITNEEKQKIEEWRVKHEAEKHRRKTLEQRLAAHGAIGGGYTYIFVPTSIGDSGTIRCDSCGEEFEFQKIE